MKLFSGDCDGRATADFSGGLRMFWGGWGYKMIFRGAARIRIEQKHWFLVRASGGQGTSAPTFGCCFLELSKAHFSLERDIEALEKGTAAEATAFGGPCSPEDRAVSAVPVWAQQAQKQQILVLQPILAVSRLGNYLSGSILGLWLHPNVPVGAASALGSWL